MFWLIFSAGMAVFGLGVVTGIVWERGDGSADGVGETEGSGVG